MLILDGTSWDNSSKFLGATGQSTEVLGVYERPGMPDSIIVSVKGTRAQWPIGRIAYIKTKNYDAAGKIFYYYQNSGMKAIGKLNVYLKVPYKGNDLGGGVLSLEPIIAEQSRNTFETQDAGPQDLPQKIAQEAKAVKANVGGFMGMSQRSMGLGLIALIAGVIIYKRVLKN